MLIKCFFCVIFFMFSVVSIFADTIYLKDGSVRKGTIIQVTDDRIEYDPDGPVVFDVIPNNQVDRVEYSGNAVSGFHRKSSDRTRNNYKTERLALGLPLVEMPFNTIDGYTFPGMYQSLQWSKSVTHGLNEGLGLLIEERVGRFWASMIVGAFDIFIFTYLPPGDAWLHEEWHRAVLSNRKISSYNDVYKLKLFADTIAVSHVKDEDLVRLKADHPRDMVRLSAAGIEAQYEFVKQSRLDYFFSGRRTHYQAINWWGSLLNSIFYIQYCTTDDVNTDTEEMNRKEHTVKERDFVGFDFTAWVYDLFRPDEAYTARGTHVSGTGIDRYIKKSDLTKQEQDYLELQFKLSLLNIFSPQLLYFNRFKARSPFTGNSFYWNAALMHYLTSFGYTVDLLMMLRQGPYNIDVILHNYRNFRGYFPGIETGLSRLPFMVSGKNFLFSARVAVWLQPEDQVFKTKKALPGGLLNIGIAVPLAERFNLFGFIEGKTAGWVAGNVDLEKGYRFAGGFEVLLF